MNLSDEETPRVLLEKALYELYSPRGEAKAQIVFVHGKENEDSRISFKETWKSFDGTTLWPKSLLAKYFKRARILSISYDSSLTKTRNAGRIDLYRLAENLVQNLTYKDVGVVHNSCPIIMIGKDIGCSVIEAICVHAKKNKALLDNIKGFFFYCPLTMGVHGISKRYKGELADKLKYGDKEVSRLNFEFFPLKDQEGWQIRVLIPEHDPSDKAIEIEYKEATGLYGADVVLTVPEDIKTICTPENDNSQSFMFLKQFIDSVSEDLTEEDLC